MTRVGNTTWCDDTPENWREFERLKERLLRPRGGRHKKTAGETCNEALQAQEARENRELKSLRRYLPGYEPDRFCR